jgi:ParB-like chromosome segregation protein Spo0J
MCRVGQVVPLIVNENYELIDGNRRREAALNIEHDSDSEFPLWCVVRSETGDSAQAAIIANIKRRGLTALQFAYLCKELRERNGWSGTAEVAQYLGVSRAQVSQHDKLLSKPAGMDDAQYANLLDLVQAGRAGADTAFYTLTHVNWEEPAAETVLDRAQEIAEADEERREAVREPKAKTIAPRGQKSASSKHEATAKSRPEPKPKPKIEKKHVRQAAEESRVIKQQTQRTVTELTALFDKLRSAAYPDPMRNFISIAMPGGAWWRGDATDKEVLLHWTQIASLVEESLEKQSRPIAKRAGASK